MGLLMPPPRSVKVGGSLSEAKAGGASGLLYFDLALFEVRPLSLD